MNGELVLREVADDGQDEPDEGNGSQQDVEREGTGEERNVVFVGGLEGAPDDAGDRAVPATFTIHASGSASSPASFRSPRTSSTFSSASSFRLRRPLVTLRRVLSPPSVGANTNPATAPST